MNAIEITNLSKVYKGKRRQEVHALKNVTLSIEKGEVFGFLGPNGAGKSTTIKTLMGQISPTTGNAFILGTPAMNPDAHKRVGYLPENPSFYEFLTGREYLHFTGRSHGMAKGEIDKPTQTVLQLMDLQDASDRQIRGYSKGMIQRLGLAQAMLHNPDLYILDEPMSGLDPLGRALVKDLIRDLKARGKTVLFSTHITADVEIVCDRVGVIDKGTLLAVDRVENILQRGVEGYIIQFVESDGEMKEMFVEQAELKRFMADVAASEATIQRIEPKRKDIEAFFLDLVAKE